MQDVTVNYLAVVVATIAGFLVGWGWYAAFGKVWKEGLGRTAEECRGPMPFTPLVIAALACLVMAWILAGLVGHLHDVTVRGAVISALFVWAGFVATTVLVNQQFQGLKPVVTAIDVGHWLAVLLVMAVIIGAFGV